MKVSFFFDRWSKFLIIVLVILFSLIIIQDAYAPPPPPEPPPTYTSSQHGDSTNGVNRSTIDAKYNTFSTGNCAHCHEMHTSLDGIEPYPNSGVSAGPDPAALFSYEEDFCETCHDGTPVPRDIKSQRLKAYHHPMAEYSGRHTLSKLEYGQNGAPFRGSSRHAECVDCHEPHYISDPGTTYHSYNATDPANNNLVSNPIRNVWGVEPTTSPLWSPPTVYTELKSNLGSPKEYQICFKCHSYYALQDADGVTALTGPSGQLVTDQAMEFSPGNKSAHPVQVTLNNQTGSSAPKGLINSTAYGARTSSPWTNIGTQTMWCCDCHGNDAASPVGPHGSANKFMLKGTRKYWPASSTGKLFSINDLVNNDKSGEGLNPYATWSTQLFCLNCHPLGTISNGVMTNWKNKVHDKHDRAYQPGGTDKNCYCIMCHSVVPHGAKRSRLIVYDGRDAGYPADPEPYRYVSGGVNYAGNSRFRKQSNPDDYDKVNCYCKVSGCTTHDTLSGSYDP